jgi:hypothetical protein
MKKLITIASVLVVLAATVLASACGGESQEAAPVTVTETVTETVEAPPDATPTEPTPVPTDNQSSSDVRKPTVVRELGGTGNDDGLAYRVQSIEEVSSIQLDEYTDPSAIRPVAGARLIAARVTVINNTRVGVGPFCAGTGVTLVDADDRNFEMVDDSTWIPDNEICGDDIQPGFQDTYTLAFQMPKSAKVAGLALWNSDSETDYSGDTYVFFRA